MMSKSNNNKYIDSRFDSLSTENEQLRREMEKLKEQLEEMKSELVGQEPIRYKSKKYRTRYNSNFIFFHHESLH